MNTDTLATASRPAITSTIGVLSDRELLRQTSVLVRHECHLLGAIIDHLAEIEARRLYLRRGCSSLFDYAVLGGGALGAAPSAPAEVASADDPVADAAPTATPSHSEPAPPLVLDAAGRQKLVDEASGKSARQVRRMLADLDPELAPPADRVRPLGGGRYELKAVIDADCQQGLEQLRGLLSHVDPRMTVGQLVSRIVQEALDRHDPSRPPRRARTGNGPAQGESEPASAAKERAAPEPGNVMTVQDAAIAAVATSTPERTPHPTPTSAPSPTPQEETDRRTGAVTKPTAATTPTPKPCAAGRAIPAAVRRQVWQRDGGRCSYLDRRTGRRCNSRHLIEIDHILPYALGGGADPGNLRLLCGAHHRHRHAPHG